MLKYTIKRLLLASVTVLIIAAITFFAMNAIPGGPFSKEKATDPTVQAMLEARFNLDKPVPEQFLIYMKNLLHGDFGISLKTGREISVTIRDSFAVSAKLGGMAAGLAVVLGLTLGSVAALTRNRWPDRVIIFLTTLFVSVPSFVLATLLLLVFCLILKWFSVFNPANPNYLLPVISLMLYQIQHAGRAGAGLHPHRPGQGRAPVAGHLQARAAQRADSGHHLRRPHDGLHPDRFDGR